MLRTDDNDRREFLDPPIYLSNESGRRQVEFECTLRNLLGVSILVEYCLNKKREVRERIDSETVNGSRTV